MKMANGRTEHGGFGEMGLPSPMLAASDFRILSEMVLTFAQLAKLRDRENMGGLPSNWIRFWTMGRTISGFGVG